MMGERIDVFPRVAGATFPRNLFFAGRLRAVPTLTSEDTAPLGKCGLLDSGGYSATCAVTALGAATLVPPGTSIQIIRGARGSRC
jgi:hypothetical protein